MLYNAALKRYLTVCVCRTQIPEETHILYCCNGQCSFNKPALHKYNIKPNADKYTMYDRQFPPQPNSVILKMEWVHSSKTMELILHTAVFARIC
jgi:hypothetical protein